MRLDPAALRALDLSGVAFITEVTPEGDLAPVGDLRRKLEATTKATPRIHTVIVCEAQRGEVEGIDPHWLEGAPGADFTVLCASDVAEVVSRLLHDRETRWGAIDDDSDELDRHGAIVGRQWLHDKVDTAIRERESGYVLLIAGPGVGKSAFVVARVRRARAEGAPPIIRHFIRRHQGLANRPEVILRSLTAQLHRTHGRGPEGSPLPPPTGSLAEQQEAFVAALRQARRVAEKVVLYVDGIDEAFGPTSAQPPVPVLAMLPPALPSGVVIVGTSRPGEFLGALSNPARCEKLDFDARANDTDIGAYLHEENRHRQLGLDDSFLEQLVRGARGAFAAAVLFLRPGRRLEDNLKAWRQDSATIPAGLNDWLQDEWQRLVDATGRHGTRGHRRITLPDLRAGLGLFAVARAPLSIDDAHAVLDAHPEPPRRRAGGATRGAGTGGLRRNLEQVLAVAAEFFGAVDPAERMQARRRFFHDSFAEFIDRQLSAPERRRCHSILARGAAHALATRRSGDELRDYGLEHRLWHLIKAEAWQDLAGAFADAKAIVERAERSGFAGIHGDAHAAARYSAIPREWRLAFEAFEHFLRLRIQRLGKFPAAYAQEVVNEFLPSAPKLFTSVWSRMLSLGSGSYLQVRKVLGPPALHTARHMGGVTTLAWNLHGHLASGSQDGTIKVWDARKGRLLAECHGHTGEVWSVAWSADGRLASASEDGTVKVWDAAGRLLAECSGHTSGVQSVAWGPDDRLVASGSADHSMKVWDAATGRLVADCRHGGPVTSVVWGPEHRLASASEDETARVWDAATGRLLADCRGHAGWVESVAWSGNNPLASGGRDGTVKVWDAATGRLLADCSGHTRFVTTVKWGPDCRLASGSDDGTVKVWDAVTGHLLADCRARIHQARSVAWSPDGRLASGGWKGVVNIWDAATGDLLANYRGHTSDVLDLAWGPGDLLASGDSGGAVKIWDTAGGRLLADCGGQTNWVTTVAWGPGGRVASAGLDGIVKVWDSSTGRLIAHCRGHTSNLESVAWGPDRLVASAGWDCTVKVWDTAAGRLIADCRDQSNVLLTSHGNVVRSVAWGPGRRLASGGADDVVKVWDSTGRLLAECHGHTGPVWSVAWGPDGRLASASADGTVKVWDAATGRLRADCLGHTNAVRSATWGLDGRLASASEDGTVKVWDAATGRLLADCCGHIAPVKSVGWAADSRLASASEDCTVKVWDVDTGACLVTLFFGAPPMGVTFTGSRQLAVFDCVEALFSYEFDRIVDPGRCAY